MPTFKTLWDNFPDTEEMKKKCINKQPSKANPFDNYCSILMSECLILSGISLSQCRGVKCWSHSGEKHILKAAELANWLTKSPPSGFGKKESINPSKFQKELGGRTGVIYFKDYWTRGNESFTRRSGDHIDLWSNGKITSSTMYYRAVAEFFGLVSDLNKSKEIWFWEVK